MSIEIGRGEVVGLIGENGAGKSTLMKISSGVYQPDAGEILHRRQADRASLDAADANRKGIGMVFQEQSLLTNLTVGENIYLGNEAQFTRFGIVNWRELYAAAARQLQGRRSTSTRACAPTTSTSPPARWSSSPRR